MLPNGGPQLPDGFVHSEAELLQSIGTPFQSEFNLCAAPLRALRCMYIPLHANVYRNFQYLLFGLKGEPWILTSFSWKWTLASPTT